MRTVRAAVLLAAIGLTLTAQAPAVDAQDTGSTPAAGPAVPILLYHHVATAPRRAPSPTLYVPAATFRRQVAALAAAGFQGVTLEQVWSAWHGGDPLPAKPVVLSFDDGYLDQYRSALPTLRARGWPGVLNLIVHSPFAQPLTSAQVRGMIAAGWELDAHTLTHPDLTKVSQARLVREVVSARTQLKRIYGVPVDFLAYPYGHVNARVAGVVTGAGYLGATVTSGGFATPTGDPARLPRIIVSPRTTPAQLVARLGG